MELNLKDTIRLAGTTCTHPKVILRDGRRMVVSCGKCPSCLSQKGSLKTRQVLKEFDSSNFCLFLTLTYDNEHVPVMWYEKTDNHYNCYDLDTNEPIVSVKISDSNLEKLAARCDLNGYLPYINRTDLPKFLKRFRKQLYEYITTHFDTKNSPLPYVRFYALSEYGAKKYRPHHHILLFFDSPEILAIVREIVDKVWTFGLYDLQYVNNSKKCAKYVAQYINGAVAVPPVFQHRKICAKNTHSFHLGREVYVALYDAYEKTDWLRFLEIPYKYSQEAGVVRSWPQIKAYFFSKPYGFSRFDIDSLVRISELYQRIVKQFPQFKESSVSEITNYIYNNYQNFNQDELKVCFPWSFAFSLEEFMEDMPLKEVFSQRMYTSRHIAFMCSYFSISTRRYLENIRDFLDFVDFVELSNQLRLSELCNDGFTPLALYDNIYTDEFVMYGNISWSTYEVKQLLRKSDFFQKVQNLNHEFIQHSIKHRELNSLNIKQLN